ncbi:MAG: GyrI-like domain-containing protein, partial [Bacteroidetes bacterium]|nr:GyrI-like domain-containing protein [Bacteroidota bacterium]
MTPRIELIGKKKLIGLRKDMSLLADQTQQLFGSFMPNRGRIQNTVNGSVVLAKIYP